MYQLFQPVRAPMSTPSVLCRREGESRQSIIVALEGDKATTEKSGVAPLVKALRDLVNPTDELLVLAILNTNPAVVQPPSAIADCISSNKECPYIKLLLQQVSERKYIYRHIFRPFYDRCKNSGIKFQVKVSVGCHPKDIIMDQANINKPALIVMDRCFARDMTLRSSDADCNISLVGEDEEAVILKYLVMDGSGISAELDRLRSNTEALDLTKELTSQEEPYHLCSSSVAGAEFQPLSQPIPESTSTDRENLNMSDESSEQRENIEDQEAQSVLSQRLYDFMQVSPLQMSEETIAAITGGFMTKISTNRRENSETYSGFLADDESRVMVKRFKGGSRRILEVEKRAALSMYHKNILALRGYHSSENTTVLVFPSAGGRSLDNYLYGSRGKEVDLTFLDKMEIAIGVAKGVRYMHEECPRGPIAHGDLRPYNVILGHDLKPQISGFGRATWLLLERPLQFINKRYPDKDPSDNPSMVLVKSDILSFGVLLLRLFCRKHVPTEDKKLIEWARPLLLERAFHELLGEETVDLDMYGLYKVMTAATQCTKTRPSSRPSMSEVISILRGESSCALQCSPSTESSNL